MKSLRAHLTLRLLCGGTLLLGAAGVVMETSKGELLRLAASTLVSAQ